MSWIIKYNANTYYAGQETFDESFGKETAYTADRDEAKQFDTKQIAEQEKKDYELIGSIIPY